MPAREPQPAAKPPPEGFEDFAGKQKREARETYDAWIAGLTDDQRAILKSKGLDIFEDDHGHVGPVDEEEDEGRADPAEWNRLQAPALDMARLMDTLADEFAEEFKIPFPLAVRLAEKVTSRTEAEVERREGRRLQAVVAFMIAPGNARLRALGLAYAAKMDIASYLGSQRAAKRQTLTTHAAISAYAIEARDLLELPAIGDMKSDEARASYSADKSSDNHWRHKKFRKKPKKNRPR